MRGRLAVDFGTSNTVVAAWDEVRREAAAVHLPQVGRMGSDTVSVVPSLIHYGEDQRHRIGNEVLTGNLAASSRTFRAMKRYIGTRSPVRRRVDGRDVSHFDAARDFLGRVLAEAGEAMGVGDEEIALTVPVEAFEHYDHWLGTVAGEAGLSRVRLIDEASAAALGYHAQVRDGEACLVFDFGGGTLDVAVVVFEEADGERRCRVVGKAGADLGGVVVDQWLFAEVLRRCDKLDTDDDVRAMSRSLLVECERVKEVLSTREQADLSVIDPMTGSAVYAEFTRTELEDLLERHEAYATITRTVKRALAAAQDRGYRDDDVRAVLMVGGSSLIPSVQRTVGHLFGRERLRLSHPLDAVARGAAAFVAGLDVLDHVQHEYAIRSVNAGRTGYEYRTLVKKGTPYPTREPVAEMTIKAGSARQTHLGVAIFEVGEGRQGAVELVFDASGAPRLQEVGEAQGEARRYFWMNEKQPTFLLADPPADKGEARFRASFSIDANKRLLITAVDLRSGRKVYDAFPVIKLQ